MLRTLLLLVGYALCASLAVAQPVSTYDPANPNIGVHVRTGLQVPDTKGDADTEPFAQISYRNDDIIGSGDGIMVRLNPDEIALRLVNRFNPYFFYTYIEARSDLSDQDVVEQYAGTEYDQSAYQRSMYGVEAGAGFNMGPEIRVEAGIGYEDRSYTSAPRASEDFRTPEDHHSYSAAVRTIVGELAEDRHYQPKTSTRIRAEARYVNRGISTDPWGPGGENQPYDAPKTNIQIYTFDVQSYNSYRYHSIGYRLQVGYGRNLDRDTKFRIGGIDPYDDDKPYINGWYQDELVVDSYILGGVSYHQKLAKFQNSYIIGFLEANYLRYDNDALGSGTYFTDGDVLGFGAGLSMPFLLASRLKLRIDYSPDAVHGGTDSDGYGVLGLVDKKF